MCCLPPNARLVSAVYHCSSADRENRRKSVRLLQPTCGTIKLQQLQYLLFLVPFCDDEFQFLQCCFSFDFFILDFVFLKDAQYLSLGSVLFCYCDYCYF